MVGKLGRAAAGVRRLALLRAGPTSPRVQRWLGIGTALALAVAAWLAFRSLPDTGGVEVWPLAIVALVGVPATMALNSVEYVIAGRMLQVSVSLNDAVRVSLQGTAANLLPIPGAAVVRVRYLMGEGATLGRSSVATVVVGITWLGTSFVLGGVVLVGPNPGLGFTALAVGATILVAAGVLLHRTSPTRLAGLGALLVAVESAAVLVQAVRYLLILEALSVEAGAGQAIALAVSVALGAAVGFMPGGLGIRELLASAIAPLVGLEAAVGLLVSVLDRLVGFVVLVPMSVISALIGRDRSDPSDRQGGDE